MKRFHKNTQPPAVLREKGPADCQRVIDEVSSGNNHPDISNLYRHKDIKNQLKSDQNGKCAYCERKFNGDFGAVEHYRPKNGWQQAVGDSLAHPGYYWLSYDWTNLLFSCDECNTCFKRNLFPLANPATRNIANRDVSNEQPLLINPSIEDPSDFIAYKKEFVVPRMIDGTPSQKGKTTIDIMGLNSRLDLKQARREAYYEYIALKKIHAILSILKVPGILHIVNKLIDFRIGERAEFAGMFSNQL